MAERSAQLAAEKKRKEEAEKSQWDHGDFWDKQMGVSGSGSGSGSGSNSKLGVNTLHAPVPKPPASALPSAKSPSPALSLSPAPATATAQPAKSSAGSFWDTPSLQPARASPSPASAKGTSAGTGAKTANTSASYDAFDDLDDFLQPQPTSKSASSRASPAPAAAPADPWDLDALSAAVPPKDNFENDYAESEDDLLGELGRPAKPKSKPVSCRETFRADPQSPRATPPSASPVRGGSPARVDSPPPHIVGQLVEMGFSPAQARAALAKTESGVDVQAALESLLGSGASNGDVGGRDELEMDDERIAREMQAREERRMEERRARHAARRAGPSRDSVRTDRERERHGHGDDADDFSKQADQLMAQASEIGASMLSKATSFWNTGKERALKVYEEQKRALDAQAAAKKRAPTDGRPRWMVEAEEAEAAGGSARREGNGHRGGAGFRDDVGGFRDEDMPPSPPKPKPQPKGPAPPQPRARQPVPSSSDTRSRIDNLFADEPRGYVSKNRHPKGRTPTASPAAASPRVATPVQLVTRQLVPASAAQITAAAGHKAKGNDHFKLGRYAEADAAYTSAISSLPSGHITLVTLHNNRAATRLKLGESGTAAADCTAAIELIGPGYHPSKETPLPADVDVKLGDALVKATVKRAQAYEMGEKWKLALEDWERVLGFDASLSSTAAASKAQASEGVRRAKRALEGGDKPASAPPPKPKAPTPAARPAPKPVDVSKSAAVSEMRAAAALAEKEDTERLALKDSVDARIDAWKAGKETNLRALIASLDTVLWDEILAGGLKVGMHQLVTEKQVKIKYMKVVARLHPDKLSTTKTTVEQRMLASATFGVLSEA